MTDTEIAALPLIKRGATGANVRIVQAILQSQGIYRNRIDDDFGPLTEDAVHYFQATHLGKDGAFLNPDGEVGPATWWALFHPVGAPQASNIVTPNRTAMPAGLTGPRHDVLAVALAEHAAGAHEIPDGSNYGDGVTKYLAGIGPAYWCAFFVSWCVQQATGAYPLGQRQGYCLGFWNQAKALGKTVQTPIPGDIFLILYRNADGSLSGSGHTGFVLRVSGDGTQMNTVEGNCGNRVKVGLRATHGGIIAGYIRLFDPPTSWEPGVLDAQTADSDTTR